VPLPDLHAVGHDRQITACQSAITMMTALYWIVHTALHVFARG
jgi:hypothetical protein